jgi:glycosyltransferase involved in cell wall biosynthesis
MIQSQVLRDDLAARAYQALERYQPDFIFDQWKKVLKIGPKKVVFLIRSLQLGGAERQLVNLVNHLDRSQIEPIILTFYAGGVLESSLRSDVQVISLHKRGRWNNLLFLMQLKAKLKALQPDIVYSFLTTSNIFAAVLRFFDDSFKLVWGIRSATMDLKRFGIVAQIEGLVENLVSRVPDLIICNADAARDDRIARGYNSSRLTVVANGIDCNEFQVDLSQRASFRANLGLTDRNFVFGIVARFDPMKGYEIFLEAAAKAIQLNSDIRFLILGSGKSSYKEQLQQLSRNLQLDSHVFWLSDVRLRDFYNALDAFTLTSLGESFPNVLAEAMSCGLPCVSTDVGDSGRIINCFGQTVPSRNPEALATAWIQMAAKGSQWDSQTISDSIRARFGLERYAEETCKAFQQLA